MLTKPKRRGMIKKYKHNIRSYMLSYRVLRGKDVLGVIRKDLSSYGDLVRLYGFPQEKEAFEEFKKEVEAKCPDST